LPYGPSGLFPRNCKLLNVFSRQGGKMAKDTPLLEGVLRSKAVRYFLPLLLTAAALVIRWLLNPFLGTDESLVSLYPVIIFSAWYCGVGPSLVDRKSTRLYSSHLVI